MLALKESIRSHFRYLPDEGRAVIDAYRRLMLLKRRVKNKLRMTRTAGLLPDPETVYWIDPARIVKHTNFVPPSDRWHAKREELPPEDRVFDPESDRGKVYGGDWDLTQFEFDDLDIARALRERIEFGTDWHATRFHHNMLARIRSDGCAPWSIASRRDLEERYRYLDALIASIRENGFRRVHEIALPGEHKGLDGDPYYGEEISVNIDRHGHYLFQDGRHRLAIAKAMRLPRVPVKVLVRHKKWMEFRAFVRSLTEYNLGSLSALYQSPVHPDLEDIPAVHACEDRFAAIRQSLDSHAGALLDVGANLGFFCHRFESLGYRCYAVELLPQLSFAAEQIRISEHRQFRVIPGDLFAASLRPPLRDEHFTVVLALNIFHHFLKREEAFRKFRTWLSNLNTESMFFEPHVPGEPQMAGAHVDFGPNQFVDFILKNSCLRHAKLIDRCADGRSLYKLWR